MATDTETLNEQLYNKPGHVRALTERSGLQNKGKPQIRPPNQRCSHQKAHGFAGATLRVLHKRDGLELNSCEYFDG